MNPRNILIASVGLAVLIPVTAFFCYRALFARSDSSSAGDSASVAKTPATDSPDDSPVVPIRSSAGVVNKTQQALKQLDAQDARIIAKFTDRLPTILAQAKRFEFAALFEEFQAHQRVLRELESPAAQDTLESIVHYRAMVDSVESGLEAIRKAQVAMQDLELGNNVNSGVAKLNEIAGTLRAATNLPKPTRELDPEFVAWMDKTHQRIRNVADSLDPDQQVAQQSDVSEVQADDDDDELSELATSCEQIHARVKAMLRRKSRFQFFFAGKTGGLGKARKSNEDYTPDELETARLVCSSARVNVILWPSKDAQIEEEWTCRKTDDVIEVVAPTAGRREAIGSLNPLEWFENESTCWTGRDTHQKVYAICLTGDYGSAVFVRCEQQIVDPADVVNTSYQFDLPESVDGEDLALNAMVVDIDGSQLKQTEADRWFHLPADMMSGIHAEIAGKIVALTGNTISRNDIMNQLGGHGGALTIEGRSLAVMLKPSIHELKQELADLDRLFMDDFRQEFNIATNREERRLSGLQRRKMLADRIVLLERKIAELTRQIARSSGLTRARLIQQRSILIARKRLCEKMMSEWIPPMLVTENRKRFAKEAMQNHVSVLAGEIGVSLFDNFGVKSGHFVPVFKLVVGD